MEKCFKFLFFVVGFNVLKRQIGSCYYRFSILGFVWSIFTFLLVIYCLYLTDNRNTPMIMGFQLSSEADIVQNLTEASLAYCRIIILSLIFGTIWIFAHQRRRLLDDLAKCHQVLGYHYLSWKSIIFISVITICYIALLFILMVFLKLIKIKSILHFAWVAKIFGAALLMAICIFELLLLAGRIGTQFQRLSTVMQRLFMEDV